MTGSWPVTTCLWQAKHGTAATVETPWPAWTQWRPNQLWCWDGSHVAVVHLVFLQRAFDTAPLNLAQWGTSIALASTLLWVDEIWKWWLRR